MRSLVVIALLASCGRSRDKPPPAVREAKVADAPSCDRARTGPLRPRYQLVGPDASRIGTAFVANDRVLVTGDTNEAWDTVDWDYGVVRIRSYAAGEFHDEGMLTNERAEHPARLGAALAGTGSTMIATDSVTVFAIDHHGTWTKQRLFAMDGREPIEHLAIAGETIVTRTTDGHVSLYEHASSGWKQVFVLETADHDSMPAAQGTVLVVGEPHDNRVRVLHRRESGWVVEETLRPPADRDAATGFGTAVAIDGDLVAVSNEYGDVVDLFRLGNGGTLVTSVRPQVPIPDFATFGTALALSGRLLAVGSSRVQNVQLFRETAGRWEPAGTATAPAAFGDHPSFGARLQLGTVLWVGAAAVSTMQRAYVGAVVGYELGDLAPCTRQ